MYAGKRVRVKLIVRFFIYHTNRDEYGRANGATNGNQLNLSIIQTTMKRIAILHDFAIGSGHDSVDIVGRIGRDLPFTRRQRHGGRSD